MRRHPFDLVSFIAGVVFVGLGFASLGGADLDPGELRWLVPIILIVLGVALLLPLRRTHGDRDEGPPDLPPAGRAASGPPHEAVPSVA